MEDLGPINRFYGGWGFLSNFWREPVLYGGRAYPTVEHAFQAAKAYWPHEGDWVAAAPNAGESKRRGRRVQRVPDWDVRRVDVMLAILQCKFAPGTRLAIRLEATGARHLEEGNTWSDTFWGTSGGRGENMLGRLLMRVRAENRAIAVAA